MLHTVHFLCPVNVSTVTVLQDQCLKALSNGATSINLHMSSSGGETTAGFTAYNFLKSLPVPVTTHNISNVESIANVIFMAGSARKANPMSRFLLHPLHWGFNGQVDHSRLTEWSSCLNDDFKRFINIMELETKGVKTSEEWGQIITSATVASPSHAAEMGMITDIAPATLADSAMNWWVCC
ncbi:ATP-dependent Clp protease proteolytic subunit [Citrobacter braakii]|uniref:ATP-dependent Clp protease proteolytic subunit n=1 Tax=Citrobacter braakii TaxID=57706 RepID=A0ABR6TZP8_CITBR|nr:ATP-dependent Clp protease proteolytic subunit [Citrobacter braakii]MBC2612368.1 ATP-dependent Clp protease proteolytic subunit [Citrobacter braakii]MBC2636340.1 ATP-dependent Clp protease proteolytic subunit [Citrobacter braakii]MBC2649059.1 ATP-dependent Clp protease proteolytic subunit [Citrobacter braakii]